MASAVSEFQPRRKNSTPVVTPESAASAFTPCVSVFAIVAML